ncbi:hypothetical protein RQN30_08585 [Arcanobacterium hippocoleae]
MAKCAVLRNDGRAVVIASLLPAQTRALPTVKIPAQVLATSYVNLSAFPLTTPHKQALTTYTPQAIRRRQPCRCQHTFHNFGNCRTFNFFRVDF